MTLEQFIEPIHNITRIRIVKGKGSRYETSEADVYIGWLGILREDKSQISKEMAGRGKGFCSSAGYPA